MYSTADAPAGFLITATIDLCLLLLLGYIAAHLEEVPHPHSSEERPGTLSPGSVTPPMSAKTAPGQTKTLVFVVEPGDSSKRDLMPAVVETTPASEGGSVFSHPVRISEPSGRL